MTPGECVRLDVSDRSSREAYERAFYEAFSRVASNRLVRQLWMWDDEARRLRTRVSYDDQDVWVSRRPDGELHFALAAHREPARAQSAAFGFSIPHDPGIFEVLTFFNAGPTDIRKMRSFWLSFLSHMHDRGCARGFATCAPHLIPLYRRAGWMIIGETEIADETRYFLTLRLDNGSRRDTPPRQGDDD